MKNYKNIVIGVVVVLAIVGAYFFPRFPKILPGATNSAAGSTFNSSKVAQINLSLASTGQNGTSTSITNTDATDRIITDGFVSCNTVGNSFTAGSGAGLINWTVQIGTTTTASPASAPSNLVYSAIISTSTPDVYVFGNASSSVPAFKQVWATGTNLTIFFNATNTAACTAGVHYLGS